MSARGTKSHSVEVWSMTENERRTRIGIALLVFAGLLLVGPNVVAMPYSDPISAIAVLGLAGGAALVGTAGDGRPV